MSELNERYLSCWNESDAEVRRSLIAEHWSEQARYTDPLAQAQGRDASTPCWASSTRSRAE